MKYYDEVSHSSFALHVSPTVRPEMEGKSVSNLWATRSHEQQSLNIKFKLNFSPSYRRTSEILDFLFIFGSQRQLLLLRIIIPDLNWIDVEALKINNW